MKENVQRLWTPDKPENQALKLECLKIAYGSEINKTMGSVLRDAQDMYSWLMRGDDQRSS